MRVLIAELKQETSSFNPRLPERELFEVLEGEDLFTLRGTNTEIAGALDVFAEHDDIDVIPTFAAWSCSGGPIATPTLDVLTDDLINAVKAANQDIDGAYISFHGAMQGEEEMDPEGRALDRIRKELGGIPIVTSFDLHGIITDRLVFESDILVAFHTYPHVDMYETGARAARNLLRLLKNQVKPAVARVKLPMLVRGDELITETGLFGQAIRTCQEFEASEGGLSAAVFIGNPFTDVPELCCQPFVFTDDNQKLAEEAVLKQANDFWPNRHIMQGRFHSLGDAVSQGASMKGPLAYYDAADAPSSGAPGDSNSIIAEMVRFNYPHRVLASVVDPPVVTRAHEVGVGSRLRMGVGGALDSRFTPLDLEWTVKSIANNVNLEMETWSFILNPGPTAVLTADNLTVVAMTNSLPMVDRTIYFANGCNFCRSTC